MRSIFFVLLALVSTTGFGDATIQTPETIPLNVAFLGPNLTDLTQSTVALLKAANRTVTDVHITGTFGTGRPAGVLISHVLATPIASDCQPATQTFSVNAFGDFFGRANEVLGFIHLANKQVYDFKFTSFFGTGKPAAGAFYYCN